MAADLLLSSWCDTFVFLAKQQSFSKQQGHATFIPFCLLLDNMFTVMISIIGFNLGHLLLLIPRYDIGSHDGNTSRRPDCEHQGRGDNKRVKIKLEMSI